MKRNFLISFLLILIFTTGWEFHRNYPEKQKETSTTPFGRKDLLENAYRYIYRTMDKYHDAFYVYDDGDSGGNHFIPSGWIGDVEDIKFNSFCSENPQSGSYCIKINYSAKGSRKNYWAGVYWLYPENNWGYWKGYDLTGAKEISFWARGEKGGEKAEFKVGGVNRFPDHDPKKPWQDSFGPLSTGVLKLSKEWKEYKIKISGYSLKNTIGGFCWVTNNSQNPQGCTIYIDNIRYDLSRPEDLRFIQSYKTGSSEEDKYLRNVAFTYDNSLALLAFLSRMSKEDLRRAKIIADSFLFVQNNDRYFNDGRLRNAYQSGDLQDYQTGKARLPGWWEERDKKWYEDKGFVGSSTGNLAWAMIALISYYEASGDIKYLNSAERLGDWIERNCKDERGSGGFTGGYEGWEPNQEKFLWKSTEHNLDCYVAFERLYKITSNSRWKELSRHAKKFIDSMWNEKGNFLWTGTLEDGITINKETIPLDTQTWAILALRDKKFASAVRWAEKNCYLESCPVCGAEGFDFNTDRDGVWFEGTAQMAVVYAFLGEKDNYNHAIEMIEKEHKRDIRGGINSACRDNLTTGFDWKYFRRLHTGATVWYIFAKLGINPYWDLTKGSKLQ
jgi:hypothetical protein